MQFGFICSLEYSEGQHLNADQLDQLQTMAVGDQSGMRRADSIDHRSCTHVTSSCPDLLVNSKPDHDYRWQCPLIMYIMTIISGSLCFCQESDAQSSGTSDHVRSGPLKYY